MPVTIPVETAVLGEFQSRAELLAAQAAQADERKTELARFRRPRPGSLMRELATEWQNRHGADGGGAVETCDGKGRETSCVRA